MLLDDNWIKQWATTSDLQKVNALLAKGELYLCSLNRGMTNGTRGTNYSCNSRLYLHNMGVIEADFSIDMNGPYDIELKSIYTKVKVDEKIFVLATIIKNMDYFKKCVFSYTSLILQEFIDDQGIVDDEKSKAMLYPLISVDHNGLYVRFRISMNGKYFLIKSLNQFIRNFMAETTEQYGKFIRFTHRIDNLEEDALPWYRMIRRFVNEFRDFFSDGLKDSCIPLNGGYLDDLFEIGCKQQLFSKFDSAVKEMKCHDYLKKIQVNVEKENEKVVKMTCQLPTYCTGVDYYYFFDDQNLYRGPYNEVKRTMEFMGVFYVESGTVFVSNEDLLYFMGSIYPQVKDYIEFNAINMDLDEYIPQEVKWSFYFDYEDQFIICKVMVDNGLKTWNYFEEEGDIYDKSVAGYMKQLVVDTFEGINQNDNSAYYEIKNNEELYNFIEKTIPLFMEFGDVFIGDRLKKIRIHHHIPIKVGISLNSNLLDIDLEIDDIERQELMEVLNSYRKHHHFHRLKNGELISLENNGSIETLAEIAETLNLKELGEKAIQVPAYRSLYLDRLLSEKEEVTFNRDQHYRSLLRDFKTVDESDYSIPESLERVLRPYQKHGYQWLKTLDHYGFGGILADEMGLGKTLQVIAFLLDYYESNTQVKPSLIVCPASLVYNWESEIQKFAPHLKVKVVSGTAKVRSGIIHSVCKDEILVTSYDLLKRDIQEYLGYSFAYEILDEAQYIKNSSTLQSKAVKSIDASGRFALTGTPIENRLSELWSIFDYLMPGLLYKYDAFRNMYEKSIIKDQDEKVMAKLKRVVGPFILRRLKKDVLKDLPEKIEKEAVAQMDSEQEKCYKAYALDVKNRLASQDEESFNKNKMQVLADLVRLRQLCCDPHLVYEDYKGGSAKLDLCLELIENGMDSGHKMLIFSQFTSMLDIIENKLKEKSIPYYVIKGSTEKKKRIEYVDAFNHDTTPVFLISLKAGGTGLNLTGANMVIHYDPWWNVAVQNQATDRAHRMGQKDNVVVYQLTCKDTIEQRIVQLQKQKQALVQEVISQDHVKLSSLSKEDLLEILG